MKITKIHLKDFHQFKDLTIDLTYPKGHEKEGQPLDKVCFIGQSGTGKTTLIELVPKALIDYNTNIVEKCGGGFFTHDVAFSVSFGGDDKLTSEVSLNRSKKKRNAKSLATVTRR